MAEDDPSKPSPSETKPSQDEPDQSAAESGEDVVAQQMTETQAAVDQLQAQVNAAASPDSAQEPNHGGIDLLGDVDLDVSIELGRTEMLVEDVLKLGSGSVVELDKLAGDPVDVYVNGRLVARGEVLVLNDNFCIRISEIVANLEEQAQAAAEEQTAQTDQEARA